MEYHSNQKYLLPYSFLLAILLINTACSNEQTAQESELPRQNPHAIELNGENKWKVDPDMLFHIRSMEEKTAEFSASGDANFRALSTELNEDIHLLTSNCTMSGKAHDELHKWLLPFIDLVGELEKSNGKDDAVKRLKAIEASFKEFNTYFQ